MLRTTLSKIRKAWTLLASRNSYDLKGTGTGNLQRLPLLLNLEKSTKAGSDKDTECEKCKELIESLFGPANTEIKGTEYQVDYNKQLEGNETSFHEFTPTALADDKNTTKRIPSCEILQSTTNTQEEDKLEQKIEVINETTLVEAQTERVDGFNEPQRVINQTAATIVDDINNENDIIKDKFINFASNSETQKKNSKESGETDIQNSFDTTLDTTYSDIQNRMINKDMKKFGIPQTTGSEHSNIQVQMEITKKRPIKEIDIDLQTRQFEPFNGSIDYSVQLGPIFNISKYNYNLDKHHLYDTEIGNIITGTHILPAQKTPVLAIYQKPYLSSVEEALNTGKKDSQSENKIVLEIFIPPQKSHRNTEYISPDVSSADQGNILNEKQQSLTPISLTTPTSNNESMKNKRFSKQTATDYSESPGIQEIKKKDNLENKSVKSIAPVEGVYLNENQDLNEQGAEHHSNLPNPKEMSVETEWPYSVPKNETSTYKDASKYPLESTPYINPYPKYKPTTNVRTNHSQVNYTENNSKCYVSPVFYYNQRPYFEERMEDDETKLHKSSDSDPHQAVSADEHTAPESPINQKTNPIASTASTFSLHSTQIQLPALNTDESHKDQVDRSFQGTRCCFVFSALPKLNPKNKVLPLSEMLRRVRLRSRIETCQLQNWELYATRVKQETDETEFFDREYSDLVEPEARRCGTKKPIWPPPAPECPPKERPCAPKRAPPCPRPCKPHCPNNCPPSTPTCPPPSPTCPPKKPTSPPCDPCAKFTKVSSKSKFYNILPLIESWEWRQRPTPNIKFAEKPEDSLVTIILEQEAQQKILQSYIDSNQDNRDVHSFGKCYFMLEELARSKTFDPWVPIPSWPAWPAKKPDKRPMVCPKEGCKERPHPKVDPCAERGGPPCKTFPKGRSFSLADILLAYSINELFRIPVP